MSTIARRVLSVSEKTYSCSDGVKLCARHWTNFDVDGTGIIPERKILCLHGWLDNAASFNRFVEPILLEPTESSSSSSSSDAADIVPTEMVCLDFPGHGLSGHKSVDGPPQLLAEYAYYVAELVEALKWGGDKENKIILIGHSMGSAISIVLTASFPEWFSSLVLLEGGMAARDSHDAPRHVRAAVQRRMKSNKTLFPNAAASNNNGVAGDSTTILPRAKVYSNLDAAIEARLSTTRRMPGDQFLSYEAAKDMVCRATVPANTYSNAKSINEEAVVFRHDPRLQWPSLQYYTREQVEAFYHDIHASNIPVCFLHAADGWPVDSWGENVIKNVLKPGYFKRLSGSHHFHADPDSVLAVAQEVLGFFDEQKL